MSFKTSAPGSLMLLGEYGVLHGHHAIVSAVNKRIFVRLTPRTDKKIIIHSHLGIHETSLAKIKIVPPFQFVLSVLQHFHRKFPSGFVLDITADFSDQMGFASSAAVTVATVKVLALWLKISFSKLELLKISRRVIQAVQGIGSGADVAACIWGGTVFYRAKPLSVMKLKLNYPLTVIYSGNKIPTPKVIKQVQARFKDKLRIYREICHTIGSLTELGKKAIQKKDRKTLGKIMDIQQGLMDALGVTTPELQRIVYTLRAQGETLGAKISGSGLGDCVIGLGEIDEKVLPRDLKKIAIKITDQGVRCEKS